MQSCLIACILSIFLSANSSDYITVCCVEKFTLYAVCKGTVTAVCRRRLFDHLNDVWTDSVNCRCDVRWHQGLTYFCIICLHSVTDTSLLLIFVLQILCWFNYTQFCNCCVAYVHVVCMLFNLLKPNSWNYYTLPYRLTYHFLISDIPALRCSALSAGVLECQKLKTVG